MEARAKFLGHALHEQLIPFPFGLLVTSVVFDLLYVITGEGELARVAWWMIAAGIVGGLLAAPFGWIDWFAIPKGTRAKKVGLLHGSGNVILLLVFVTSWLLRRSAPEEPSSLVLALSLVGLTLAIVTGWLGGELVDRHAIAVDEGAHPDSPHSLSGRPASEGAPARPGATTTRL
jgi:uncharacterized membrane protein